MNVASKLPTFPWDTIANAKARALKHPDGIVDLSVGTPVDPVPTLVQEALANSAAKWCGYPTVWGTSKLREAIIDYLVNRWNAVSLTHENVLPVMGTKELVAWLPTQLGLSSGSVVVIPETAYPTYEVGALLAGAEIVRCDDPGRLDIKPSIIWINSPANPHGAILSASQLRDWVLFARKTGALLASDECYGEFAWDAKPVSVLDPTVNDGSLNNILATFSLSKQSNMAGYRAGFVAGDQQIVTGLLAVRKHAGAIVPGPVQDAMAAALADSSHVAAQRERYLARRSKLATALRKAGFQIDDSQGSLYLWATRNENCRVTVDWLADRGILVAPGDFYSPTETSHVRIALTACDERIDAACSRLAK